MKYLKLTLLAILLQQNFIFSQQIRLKEKQLDDKGKIAFAIPETNFPSTPEEEIIFLQAIASPEKRLTFHLSKTVTDQTYQHNYYNISFMNLEIVGADYVIHSTDKKILFANGNLPYITDSIYNVNPKIGFEQAQLLLFSRLSANNKKFSTDFLIKKISNKGLVWFAMSRSWYWHIR